MYTIYSTENSRRFRAGEIYSTELNTAEMNLMEATMTVMRYVTIESERAIESTLELVRTSPRPTKHDLTRPEARPC